MAQSLPAFLRTPETSAIMRKALWQDGARVAEGSYATWMISLPEVS